jgi:hypothetical protein
MQYYILLGIILVVIQIAVAFQFGRVAEQKGYSGGNYIAACIFGGLPVYLLVIALPDMEQIRKQETQHRELIEELRKARGISTENSPEYSEALDESIPKL